MGKLHKIRKAVEANPERWIVRVFEPKALGVYFGSDGKITPDVHLSNIRHRRYVRSILRKLGYIVK